MKKILLFALTLFFFSAGCTKKNTPQPGAGPQQPETTMPAQKDGSILVKITPLPDPDIALVVSNISTGQKVIIDKPMNNYGEYYILNLSVGTYNLDISANARFLPLDKNSFKVTAGDQTDVGTITLKPNPDNGSIVGTISPVRAASTFIVQCIEPLSSNTYSGVIDPATGKFEIKNLPPGKWTLSFPANNGFKAPQGVFATVTAKQATDIGTVTFESAPFISSISFKTSGYPLPVYMNGNATYDGTKLSLSGRYTKGVMNSIGDGTIQLAISLDRVTAPGTYVCNSTTTSKFTYSQKLYGLAPPNGSWSSLSTGATAIVVVTGIDLDNKTVSGTFTASLGASTTSAVRQMEITNGSFTATYNK